MHSNVDGINDKTCCIEISIEIDNRVNEQWYFWLLMLKHAISKEALKGIIVSMNDGIFGQLC